MLWIFIVLVIMDLASAAVSIPAWAYLIYIVACAIMVCLEGIAASNRY
jgi:hypothetical protein